MDKPAALKDRAALAATVLLFVTVAGPLMWSAVSPDAIAAAPTTYSFDECNEGWQVTENMTGPETMTKWARSQPGAPAEPQGFAFRSFPYPTGDFVSGDFYIQDLTSAAHTAPGGPLDITYFVSHDMETPTPAGPTADALYLEWSSNGETWTEAKKYIEVSEGYPTFLSEKVTIEAPKGPFYLRFRMISDGSISGTSAAGGQVAVDEIVVPFDRPAGAVCGTPTGNPSQTPTGTQSPTARPSQTPTATPSPSPNPNKCTKSGTNKSETLRGTSRADVLCGKGGNDKILGLGGNDVLKGQGGKDTLKGGPGNDNCIGGPGRDRFKACEKKKQ